MILLDVFFGPRDEAVARLPGRVSDPEGWIVLDQLRLGGPAEQPAHGIKKVTGLCWRARASLSASHDDLGRDLSERLVSGCLDDMQEDVLALPPSRRRQGRPCRGLAIAGNEPPKGAERLALDLLWACRTGDGCLVLGAELRRHSPRIRTRGPLPTRTYQTVLPCRV